MNLYVYIPSSTLILLTILYACVYPLIKIDYFYIDYIMSVYPLIKIDYFVYVYLLINIDYQH